MPAPEPWPVPPSQSRCAESHLGEIHNIAFRQQAADCRIRSGAVLGQSQQIATNRLWRFAAQHERNRNRAVAAILWTMASSSNGERMKQSSPVSRSISEKMLQVGRMCCCVLGSRMTVIVASPRAALPEGGAARSEWARRDTAHGLRRRATCRMLRASRASSPSDLRTARIRRAFRPPPPHQ